MASSNWTPRSGAVVGRYTLSEAVARGSTANIWRASPSDPEAVRTEDVAIKCISGGRVRQELIDTEVETLRLACGHANVVTLLKVVLVPPEADDELDSYQYLYMETQRFYWSTDLGLHVFYDSPCDDDQRYGKM